ncbi:hypothetical protein AVEN_96846-1 [Araneus ventricosus]|uniref:Uncharacterized protein n=1 Tax=Araneus ventricosus TaxID=182803 RepID=A0A4Y2J8T3_ARAVE|nr:hypothetical protein AVEN_96846-1 [Araneus ventricosus]
MRSKKQTEWQQLLMESSLACRRGMEGISRKQKAKGRVNWKGWLVVVEFYGTRASIGYAAPSVWCKSKLEGSRDPWVPRDWDTRTHLKKVSP